MKDMIINRSGQPAGVFSGICDGKLYKELCASDTVQEGSIISFTFNTDGIPVFKSSKSSFWPLFLTVNELPYRIR